MTGTWHGTPWRRMAARAGLIVALVVALAVPTRVAQAWFSASGTGTGTGAVSAIQDVTISAVTAVPTSPLLPGQSGDATFTVDNPNDYPVTIVAVVADGAVGVSGGSGCTPGNAGVTFTDQTGLMIDVAAHATAQPVDLPGAVSMSDVSADGCQGASFTVPVQMTAHSS